MEQDSTYVVYVFANMVNVWPQWGIQLCDSHGRVVWNTEMLPLEVKNDANMGKGCTDQCGT
ncbi:hypothetical protein PSK87_04670 [Escherichia coli]|nr:hypothetical protein [Escherichia coli]